MNIFLWMLYDNILLFVLYGIVYWLIVYWLRYIKDIWYKYINIDI